MSRLVVIKEQHVSPNFEFWTNNFHEFLNPSKFQMGFADDSGISKKNQLNSIFDFLQLWNILPTSEFLLNLFGVFRLQRNSFQNSIEKAAEFQLWTYFLPFIWRFLNSRNFEIGIQTRIPFVRIPSKKQLNLTLFFHIFSSFGTFYHGWSRRFHPFSWTRDHRKVCYTIHKKWLYISFAVSYFY